MKRVGIVIQDGFSVMSFAAISAFEAANLQLRAPAYDVGLLSQAGGRVCSSSGIDVASRRLDDSENDTIVVAGGTEIVVWPKHHIAPLQAALERCRRIGSFCTGAFSLAQTGLLDGRNATTHWFHARTLQKSYPRVQVKEDRIFVRDGAVWTSAGMSAGIDLAIALIEDDHGVDLARSVARQLVIHHRRAGGQSQHSALLDLDAKSDRIQTALSYAKHNLHRPLSVPQLAEAARLSPRQFSRAFLAETGQSPAKALIKLRLEAARLLMSEGSHPFETIAQQTGFVDRERMRRAFLRVFGQPPQAMRRLQRTSNASPCEN